MAKLQEIIAKREELAKTNPNATNVDARKALTATPAPIANAPVAGVAPAITPPTPAPVVPPTPTPAPPTPGSFGEKTQGMNVDQRQAVRAGVVPPSKEGTTTPSGATLTPEGQIVQPGATPTPIPPTAVKPTPKVDAVDYTQGAGREADINKNLNEFYNQGTTDPTALKTMSGYAEATPEKKAIIDAFISAKAPNADNMFMSLRSGVAVAQSLQNTPEYKQAQARYNKLQTYQRYSPSQVTTALRTGDIIPGTKEYNDLYTDPQVKAKIDEANAFAVINGGYDFNAIGVKKTSELISQNTNVSNALSDGYISEEELTSMTNTQEVTARATDYQTKSDLYTKKKTEYDNIDKTVRADMDKLGLSSFSSIVNARVAEAREALLPELTIAQNEMNTSYGIYTDAKAQALSVVDRNIALYQEQQKFAQQKEMVQYQADVGLQTQQREFEQGLEQQAQLASDPVTGVNNIVDTFEKMGIFADRSRQEMVQEVQSKMAQGMTVGEALSDLQKAFKSKPEYQRIQAQEAGKGISYQTIGDKVYKMNPDGTLTLTNIDPRSAPTIDTKPFKVGDQTYQVNPNTGEYEVVNPITAGAGGDLRYLASQFPGQAWAKNNNPAGITWNANFDNGTGTAKLLADAGVQFSKGTARPASEGGNYVTFPTIEDGLKAQQIIMAQTYGDMTVGGMLSKWVGTSEGPNYAKQVAGMAGVDPNVKVSSLTPEQLSTLQMAKIKKESPGLYNILSQETGKQGVSPEAQSWVNAWNNGTMDIETILTKIGSSKEVIGLKNEVIKAIDSQGGVAWRKESDPVVTNVKKLSNTVDSLLADKEQLQNVSGGIQRSPWDSLTKKKQTYLSNIQNLLDTNTLQQLIDAKAQGATFGALSNEELKMLQASASSLAAAAERDDKGNIIGFRLTEAELEKKLKELQTQYVDKISRMTGGGIASGQPTNTAQPTGGDTLGIR